MEYDPKVLLRIEKYLSSHPNAGPLIIDNGTTLSFTSVQMLEEIKKRTPRGNEFYKRLEESLKED